MTLYNKYRPKSFSELVQSKYSNGLSKDSLTHHAYLFFGPPGTGKTSTARLCMAEYLNEKDIQQAISGNHPDYVEINCAVNNGVDDIRSIVSDVVNTLPVQSDYKFIIFDECLDYNCKIELKDGSRVRIGKIVNNKIPAEVLSFNFQKNCFEYKKITNWFKNSKKEVFDWCFKSTKTNKIFKLRASENHKIFSSNDDEIRLADLNESDKIKVVQRTKCQTRKKAYDYKTRKFSIGREALMFIMGTLIGDGSISKRKLSRIRFNHSVQQRNWIELKKEILGDLVATYNEIDNEGYGEKLLNLTTLSCKELNDIYDELIIDGKKTITRSFLNKLDPISWAAWFLDDGSSYFDHKGDLKGISIATHSFSKEENMIIQKYFKEEADIDFVLQLDKTRNKWYLRANKDSATKFIAIISPFCCYEILSHKFPKHMILGEKFKQIKSVKLYKEDHSDKSLYQLMDAEYIGKKPVKLHGKYTYDIEVEDNHNYVANFTLVHNCHMLTNQAQNALLKTVEEPPEHIKFFFCTTEINKVLPAIRSRCQIVPFLKLSDKALEKIIGNVCAGEGVSYNTESAKMIMSLSDGSARSSINLLEQCLSVFDSPESVGQILGTTSFNNFRKLTELIYEKNRVDAVRLLDELFNNSVDPGSLMNKYADYLADLITQRLIDKSSVPFDGKKLLIIADCVTDILKDFKILQNIKLISKINVLKAISKIN
jgi:DNA polymerase III gamma/tau subunit